ncbi:MAG: hypothetical protein ACE5EL_08455 [Anaerolineae bacterium]
MTTVRPDPARRFAEATALAAALAVPLFFAPAADIAFEVPKAALIRFLGAAALGALVVPRRRRPRAGAVASYLRTRRLLAALMVTVAVEALATATSVVPFTSLLGSHARGQGLATSMALLALTLAAASANASSMWRSCSTVSSMVGASNPPRTLSGLASGCSASG